MKVGSTSQASRALRAALHAPPIWDLIAPLQCGWLDGGCAILADALVEWLGNDAMSMVVTDVGRPHHVVACYRDLYVDGDGISTKRTLLTRWRTREQLAAPRLEHLDVAAIANVGIPRDSNISRALARAFGDYQPLASIPPMLMTTTQRLL